MRPIHGLPKSFGTVLVLAALVSAPVASGVAAVLPPGFKISVLARVPGAREMAVCGATLYVGTTRSAIYAVALNGAGGAARVAATFDAPNGVACLGDRLYVASQDRISAFALGANGAVASGPVTVRGGLPNKAHHGLRYIQAGPDGRLYVSLGSPCNICLAQGLEGTIVAMNGDGSGLQTVATGIRNSVGFDWHPGTRNLFFTDNGADNMGDDIPPDELNEVLQPGGFYGFPYLGGRTPLKGFEAATPPQASIPPVFEFPAHVATLGIHFYTGTMLPAEFRGDAFVAEHGSWNRTVPDGYQVVRVRFAGGRPVGAQSFVSGVGRPVDVKELPDGSLLISDDSAGVIYHVTYGG